MALKEVVQLAFSFVLAAASSYLATLLIVRLLKRRMSVPIPVSNARVRFSSGQAMYRSRFLEAASDRWSFAAPMSRDAYVPITLGTKLIVETYSERGKILFETTVIGRSREQGSIEVAVPTKFQVVDRRTGAKRWSGGEGEVCIGDFTADVIDRSQTGIAVRLRNPDLQPQDVNEEITVRFPGNEVRLGRVVEAFRAQGATMVRIAFQGS